MPIDPRILYMNYTSKTTNLAMEEEKHHIGEKCQEYGCNIVMEKSLRLEEEFKEEVVREFSYHGARSVHCNHTS